MFKRSSQLSLRDGASPNAIVIGLDCVTGLQTARILARHNVPVIGVAQDPEHFCCRTNACARILAADHASDELIRALETLGPELKHKAVLFPCTDMSVLLISRYRARLEDWYHIDLANPEVIEMLMSKTSFYRYAQREGIPIPATYFLHNTVDAEQAAEKLNFPCILKPPLRTPTWTEHSAAKVYKADNAEEFLALCDRCAEWSERLAVQEWVEATDADLYTCYCYFNADSEPVATFVARKLRQWPPQIGTSSLGEECRNDRVLEETVGLFKKVGYRGLGYVEMKRDKRSGEYFIIEPNIGRSGVRSAIAEAGGVELLYARYCYTLGWPLPPNLEQKYGGVKWIYWMRDLQSAFSYWRRGELTLRQWWRSCRGRKVSAVFSWSDLGPFLSDLLRILPKISKKAGRTDRASTESPRAKQHYSSTSS